MMNNETLFRKSSLNSISSPDQLNDYIKVANPSVWLVLGALFVLLAAVLVWSVTGSLPTTLSAKGVLGEGQLVCYVDVDAASALKAGQSASIADADGTTRKGHIASVGEMPMSAAEISSELRSEYLTYALIPGQFAVKLTVAVDASGIAEGTVLEVSIVSDAVRPIDFLLGR